MPSRQPPGTVLAKRQQCSPSDVNCTSSPPSPSTSSTSAATSSAAQTSPATSTSSTSNAGTIAGSVIGGVVFLVLVVLGILLYLRARKRERTPPSSEFINSLKAGATPVLRLDSGAEYTPTLAEKGGVYTHYPPAVPLPFMQNSYCTSPPMQNMKFPDEMMVVSDAPSGRPSFETPFHPQRFSSQQQVNDSFVSRHQPSASVGSRRELWGCETDIASGELSPVRQSPICTDSVLQFAPRISLEEPCTQSSFPSHSPASLQPLRRQPDPEGVRYL